MIVLVGASGSGKTTVLTELQKLGLRRVVTYTTRPKRENEINGVDYNFISEEDYRRRESLGQFIESMNYRGWYYGVGKRDCERKDGAIVLTPHGLRTLNREGIPTFSVYLATDRRECLMRMLRRGDDIEEAYRRNLTDVGQFDGISEEVDLVIAEPDITMSPDNLAKYIKRAYGRQIGASPFFYD